MKRPNRININGGWHFRFADEPPHPVMLPHTWNAFDTMHPDPAQHYRRGVGIYTYTLDASFVQSGERLWLHIEAAAQKANIYFDDRRIGEHWGGYIPFALELPPQSGTLKIEVDNRPDIDLIPSDLSDFFLYGGLTRNVWLYTTGAHTLQQMHITPHMDGRVKLSGRVSGGRALSFEIYDPADQLVFEDTLLLNGDTFDIACQIPVLPWSPDAPHLYRAKAQLLEHDSVECRFGFRDFSLDRGFSLNGERLLLRGTHRHEDWAGYGAAVPDDISRHELGLIKEAGFNFVRLGHYPQAPAVLDACDELGLLVWLELPWCRGGIGGEVFRQRTRDMLIEMIDAYYNHPSIIFWGLGNELDWESEHPDSTDEKVAAFLQELHDLSHQLDPHRLTALRRFEPGAPIVDVYSPSIWSGWYRGRYQDYEGALRAALDKYPNFFHAEWGGDSHIGRHNTGPHIHTDIAVSTNHEELPWVALSDEGFARASRDSDWSESYMLDVMEWHLQIQQRLPNLSGSAQWIFSDFGTPLRPENPIPYVNQKGLVDRAGHPKDLFYLFKAYQTDDPVLHIESPTWHIRTGDPAEKQRIRVYSNCAQVTLIVNDHDCGTLTRDPQAFPAGGLVWWVAMRSGENRVRAVGVCADGHTLEHQITQQLVSPSQHPPARFIPIEDEVLQLVDAFGAPLTNPDIFAELECISGGVLQSELGTSQGSRRVQTANGRLRFSLVRDGQPVVMRIRSDYFEQTLTDILP